MGKEAFWQGHRAVALGQGVPEAKAEWFVKWAQRFEPFCTRLAVALMYSGTCEWLRYPYGTGITRTCGCLHDHDLYPCAEQAGASGKKPGG
ncbi:MAG: hypothetical protein A3G93_09520 [Nitrospinae bacterium RIFCSPLOWO2_12_FULL_45_22]|nr:MAG: hypothetical protein A3G93_09520 [Nitrospinae bacterium RIFCSPLOWO2_12_FULL_45_22]